MKHTFEKQDYTAIFAPLTSAETADYPLYEYDRASEAVLSAIMNGLVACGATEDEAIAFMQMKTLRHMFDGGLQEAIEDAAFAYVRQHAPAELAANRDDMRELAKTNKPFRTSAVSVFEQASAGGKIHESGAGARLTAYEVDYHTVGSHCAIVWAANAADAVVKAKDMYEFGVEPFATETHGPRGWRVDAMETD